MPGWFPLSIGYYDVDGTVNVEKTIHHTNTVCVSIIQTDRSGIQFSRVLAKNYSTTPRVPMGIWGSVCDPRTQI